MNAENWISLVGTAATLLVGVLAAEGLTFKSRARRRAKLAAEVVSGLPEGSEARSIALSLAELEVRRWRRYAAPTPAENAQKAGRLNLWASIIGAIGVSLVATEGVTGLISGGMRGLAESSIYVDVVMPAIAVLLALSRLERGRQERRRG